MMLYSDWKEDLNKEYEGNLAMLQDIASHLILWNNGHLVLITSNLLGFNLLGNFAMTYIAGEERLKEMIYFFS